MDRHMWGLNLGNSSTCVGVAVLFTPSMSCAWAGPRNNSTRKTMNHNVCADFITDKRRLLNVMLVVLQRCFSQGCHQIVSGRVLLKQWLSFIQQQSTIFAMRSNNIYHWVLQCTLALYIRRVNTVLMTSRSNHSIRIRMHYSDILRLYYQRNLKTGVE